MIKSSKEIEIEKILSLKEHRNNRVWRAADECIQAAIQRLTDELVSAKPEKVPYLQGAIREFKQFLTSVNDVFDQQQ